MKTPKTLIREYEAEGGFNGIRLYSYVRPRKGGECTYEVWAAVNARRKGKPLYTKCVYKMRSDSESYKVRDTVVYNTFCCLAHDHLIYDFYEAGYTRKNFENSIRDYKRGRWDTCTMYYNAVSGHSLYMLPIAHTALNGLEETKYRYCAYTPRCGLAFAEYLHLYKISPKVELLSKAELWNLLSEDICRFLADHPPFGKFLAKNISRIKGEMWSVSRVKREYAKQDPAAKAAVRQAKLEAEERKRKARIRAERRRRAEELKRYRKYDAAIAAMYERVKEICADYGAYEVIVPQSSREMLREGEAMHNCIGKLHSSRVADGTEICLFLHKDGKPCVDVSIDLTTFKVTECRAVCNKDAPKCAWTLAEKLAKKVGKRMRGAA